MIRDEFVRTLHLRDLPLTLGLRIPPTEQDATPRQAIVTNNREHGTHGMVNDPSERTDRPFPSRSRSGTHKIEQSAVELEGG